MCGRPARPAPGGGVERWGRFAFRGIAAVFGAVLLAGSARVPLLDPDEARFARTSLEMMRSGDLAVPTFEGAPRLAKPPLLHWLQSALYRPLGPTELASRLPSMGAAFGTLLLLGWAVRRRFGEEGAAWAAAAFASFPLVVALGKVGTIDALLSLHVFAVLALDLAAAPREAGRVGRAAMIGVILGLAFLGKGPVGVIVPLLAMLTGRTATGRDPLPSARAAAAGALAWCAVVLPWGLAFASRLGWDTAAELARTELLHRYFEESAQHAEPAWYYLLVAAVGLAPWAATLAIGAGRALVRRRDPSARTAAYAAAAFLAGLAFLSIGRGKLPSYILPLAPLAAVVVAWEIGVEIEERGRRRLAPAAMAVSLAVAAAVLLAVPRFVARPGVGVVAGGGSAIFGAAAVAAAFGAARGRVRLVHGAGAAAGIVFACVAVAGIFPVLGRERSAYVLVEGTPELHEGRPVVVVEKRIPSLCFYLDRVPEWVGTADLGAALARRDRPLFVVDAIDLPGIPAAVRDGLREVAQRGRYRVLEPRLDAPRQPL